MRVADIDGELRAAIEGFDATEDRSQDGGVPGR